MKTPYGFVKNNSGFSVNPFTSMIVKELAALYLNGYSLGRIIEVLEKRTYPSPSGNTHWSRSVIDAITGICKMVTGIAKGLIITPPCRLASATIFSVKSRCLHPKTHSLVHLLLFFLGCQLVDF